MYSNRSDDTFRPADLNGWQAALDAHGRTEDDINTMTGDPQDRYAVARREVHRCNNEIPFIYRRALADHPDVVAWADTLIKEADGPVIPMVRRGPSVLLLGVTGVGKTHQAYGALRYMAPAGIRVGWTAVSAVDLYASLRPRSGVDSEAEFWKYAKAPVLLIDDLGAERKATEFTEEVNFRLVNHRYQHQLPTLFTSNVRPKQLAERVGDRVASRLVEMCGRVVMEGVDRRRQEAA